MMFVPSEPSLPQHPAVSAHSDLPDSLPLRALGTVSIWNIQMSTEHLSTSYLCTNMTCLARLSFLYSGTVDSNSVPPALFPSRAPITVSDTVCAVRTYSFPCCLLPTLQCQGHEEKSWSILSTFSFQCTEYHLAHSKCSMCVSWIDE